MAAHLSPAHSAALRQETAVSVAINALLPAAVIWLLDVTPPKSLLGPHPILAAIVPASGLATFVMTVVLTSIVRARVAGGRLPALIWPANDRGLYRFIPSNLALRGMFLALIAIVCLVPPALVLVAVADILPLTKPGALAFNIAFGAVVGLAMTRFVVLPALADCSPT